MIERGRRPPLALEAPTRSRVATQLGSDHLEGDEAPEIRVVRTVDDAHAADAGYVLDDVAREGVPGRISVGTVAAFSPRVDPFAWRVGSPGSTDPLKRPGRAQ